jgi:hypothetical protein
MTRTSRSGAERTNRIRIALVPLAAVAAAGMAVLWGPASAGAVPLGIPYEYTLDADFDAGMMINVNHDAPNNDQLQLDDVTQAFNFVWIAASARGTVVKINTQTGAILGEFRSAPLGMGQDPSRTTVDQNGNVWVTNRNEFGFVAAGAIAAGVPPADGSMGSVIRIGLVENGQCEDRNGNGIIDTSTGLGDIRPWPNTGSADTLGGVSTAEDECIIDYTRVNSTGTRHVSVNSNNDVWVSGFFERDFDLLDGTTAQIVRQEPSVGYGGYGGLIDANDVIWSANRLMRWDTALPLNLGNVLTYEHDSYGLCIDSSGNVWNTSLSSDQIRKFAPDGTLLGTFSHGNFYAQGCVVDMNDEVWVAHSLFGATTVGHLLNDGTYIGNVPLTLGADTGNGPTGVAVDGDGKIWVANINTNNAMRIDPNGGPLGADGVTPVGAVDVVVDLGAGAGPYNYSDMTGSTLIGAPENGTWAVVHDSGAAATEWGTVSWNSDEPGDSAITVMASSSADGVVFGAPEAVTNGTPLSTVAPGQYLKVEVSFVRSTTDGNADGFNDSPILFDLTIAGANEPPICEAEDVTLWPPNHKLKEIPIDGVTDPDGDAVDIVIDYVTQDEPLNDKGDGNTCADAVISDDDTVSVRAERSGKGNGRVYEIGYTATDGQDTCSGTILVFVPHNPKSTAVDDGQDYDSTDGDLCKYEHPWKSHKKHHWPHWWNNHGHGKHGHGR